MDAEFAKEIEVKLREMRAEWSSRLDAIQSDRRRANGPLDPDFEEQATERENDATLDALDARGRQAIDAVDAALRRVASKTFGRCVRCNSPISKERLLALPTAAECVECAQEQTAG